MNQKDGRDNRTHREASEDRSDHERRVAEMGAERISLRDEFVPRESFEAFLRQMPQVCVELVVTTDRGFVLARRFNRPARGEWFWPGSRLYKGAHLEAAARRVGREELGIEVTVNERLGVAAHFWTAEETGTVDRHTVNVVFEVTPAVGVRVPADLRLDEQHSEVGVFASVDASFHPYVREYVDRFDLASSI